MHPTMIEAARLTRAGSLAEATALIRATLGGSAAAAPEPAPARTPRLARGPVPQPATAGSFTEQSHTGAAGTLRYRLYVPAGAAAGMPVVVMLHGCTQGAEDFARGTGMNALADAMGFIVVYPEQAQAANAQRCWNWFRPGDQQRDRGEPALIAGVTRAVLADQRADATRVYVAGLSAGGAAAAIMADAYPDLYAAAGIHSGLACGAARDLPGALGAMRRGGGGTGRGGFVPVIAFHGDRDTTVHAANSAEIVAAAARAAGVPLTTRTEEGAVPGGRRYTRAVSRDAQGHALIEQWTVHGAGHAWSGGHKAGSYTDPQGPDASREMLRFFLEHRLA